MPSEARAADLLERAAQADRQARSDDALDLLEGSETWPKPYNERALLLRANILMVRDPIAALDLLPETADAFSTHEGRVGFCVTSARAYRVARNVRAAEEWLDAASRLIDADDDPYRYRIAFLRAHIEWNRRRYDPDNVDIAVALSSPEPDVRFHAVNLRAWMCAGLEDFSGLMRGLQECIALYDRYGELCRIRSVAMCLHSILGMAWELGNAEACEHARRVFDALPWTDDTAVPRFACLRGLAFHAFLQGDTGGAKQRLAQEDEAAPTPAWRALARVDEAFIAHLSGDDGWAADALARAEAAAEAIDWRATRDEERVALIELTVMLSRQDPLKAKRVMHTHQGLFAHSLREAVEMSHDSRYNKGYQLFADGRLQQGLGNTATAARLLERSYEIFSSLGFAFRATLAAQALFEVTGDARWIGTARTYAAAFPKAAFSQRLGAMAANAES